MSTPPETSQAFHLPVLVMTWPATVDEMNRPPIIGIVMTPDIVGDLPRASWKYCEKNTVPVNIATPTKSEAIEASVMVRLRKSRSGMIGSAALVSTKMKISARTTAPPTIAPVCQESQSYLSSAKVTHRSRVQTAAVMKKAPAQSTFTLSRLTVGSFSVFCRTMSAMIANGTPT